MSALGRGSSGVGVSFRVVGSGLIVAIGRFSGRGGESLRIELGSAKGLDGFSTDVGLGVSGFHFSDKLDAGSWTSEAEDKEIWRAR